MGKVFEKIYEVVRGIPRGEVMSYGEVARRAGTTARVVGWALHVNKKPEEIPCHRVVGKGGVLRGYAFGGVEKQRRKLEEEGVRIDKYRVGVYNLRYEESGTERFKGSIGKNAEIFCFGSRGGV